MKYINEFEISSYNFNVIVDQKLINIHQYLNLSEALILLFFSIIMLIFLIKFRINFYKRKFLKQIAIPKNDNMIFGIEDNINFDIIVQSAQDLEKILSNDGQMTPQQQHAFELSLEMMENMLKHSLNSADIGYGKKETKACFQLIYNPTSKKYILKSCNIVDVSSKYIIEEKVNNYKRLDMQELKKLARDKMKNKDEDEKKDSGLGYILLTRRSSEPISILFTTISDHVIKFNLEVKV
jgi:hypothetical protein